VSLGSIEKGYRHLCLRCYNAVIAEHSGIDFEHVDFQPVTVADADGVPHQFRFFARLFGAGIALAAHEIKDDDREGYEFHVISPDPEGEPLELFRQLFEKMRRSLAQKHLQRADGFGLRFAESLPRSGQPLIPDASNAAHQQGSIQHRAASGLAAAWLRKDRCREMA